MVLGAGFAIRLFTTLRNLSEVACTFWWAEVLNLLFIKLRCLFKIVQHAINLLSLLHLMLLGGRLLLGGLDANICPTCFFLLSLVCLIVITQQSRLICLKSTRLLCILRRLWARKLWPICHHDVVALVLRGCLPRDQLDNFLSRCDLASRVIQL